MYYIFISLFSISFPLFEFFLLCDNPQNYPRIIYHKKGYNKRRPGMIPKRLFYCLLKYFIPESGLKYVLIYPSVDTMTNSLVALR